MAKSGKVRLSQAVQGFGSRKEDQKAQISGILGFVIAGQEKVEVPGRPGFVYVRIRDNFSEVIQAYNENVSPVYGLPVYVSRDTLDTTRYIVTGRDTARYSNWITTSPYLPRHGNQHSFAPEVGGGGDITWIDERQVLPLLLYPSGSLGAGSVVIHGDTIWQQDAWRYVGGTGTPNLLANKPSGSSAVLILVYIDSNGNPQTTIGSYFDNSITGSSQIIPYLPSPPSAVDIPLGAVRLVSGTSSILWDNIYDLRAMFRDSTVATGSSGGSAHIIQKDGSNQTQRNYLNFVGDGFDIYDNGVATVISGTSGGGGGGSSTLLIYDDGVAVNTASRLSFDTGLSVVATGSSAFVSATGGGGGGSGGAWTQIGKVTIGATGSSGISFSSITGSYNNLKLTLVARSTRSDNQDNALMYFNGDTGSNYNYQYQVVYAATSAINEVQNTTAMLVGAIPAALSPGGVAAQMNVDIFAYTSPFNKTVWAEDVYYYGYTSGLQRQNTYSGYWKNVSAITKINLYVQSGGFASGTVAVLYGIT